MVVATTDRRAAAEAADRRTAAERNILIRVVVVVNRGRDRLRGLRGISVGARVGGCGNQLQGRAGFVVDGGSMGEELLLWSASKQCTGR